VSSDGPDATDDAPRLTGAGLLGLGIANAVCLLLGLLLGHLADNHFGSAPVGVLVGLASGILLGILGTASQVRRYLG
jgi:F0F1-type ATP synthase assembly protein I